MKNSRSRFLTSKLLRKSLTLGILGGALVALPATADPVLDWNARLMDAIRAQRVDPPRATRQMAILNVSIFDAVNGLDGAFVPYHGTDPAPAGASAEAAAIAAAHRALMALYPALEAEFDAARDADLATIPDGPAKSDGVDWGVHVADQILALRADDGSAAPVGYEAPLGANWWAPTPPAFAPPLRPNWATLRPWTMSGPSQFRVAAPPPLTSAAYTAAFEEVRRLGDVDSAERTADQSEIARFWDDGVGTQTPPGHWNEIVQLIAEDQGNSLIENARLFALQGMTVADAAIVAWDNKYHYGHWRPYTGIREADTDANPATGTDPTWDAFIINPPFPAYTSGHSSFSGSSAKILELFYGRDDIPFTVGSDGVPGVTRSFDGFTQAAEEAGQSRIYGGIHWQYDNQGGLSSGRALAQHVFFNFLRPQIQAGGTCTEDAETLCLSGGRFEVRARWRTPQGTGGPGMADPDTADSGRFWFFAPDNTEVVVKVLDACSFDDHFWVFSSGLTNVEVQLTVTDTMTGERREYFNPLRQQYRPVLDTTAFATCP